MHNAYQRIENTVAMGSVQTFNIQEVDDTGITPLTVACVTGHTRITKMLIEHGAIVNFIDKVWKIIIFFFAIILVHVYIIIHIIIKIGHSSLYDASGYDRTETVRLLLQNGADVNLPTEVMLYSVYTVEV